MLLLWVLYRLVWESISGISMWLGRGLEFRAGPLSMLLAVNKLHISRVIVIEAHISLAYMAQLIHCDAVL